MPTSTYTSFFETLSKWWRKKLHVVIFSPSSLKEIEVIGNRNMLSMQRVLNANTQCMSTLVLEMFLPCLLRHIYRLIVMPEYVFQCDMSCYTINGLLVTCYYQFKN
jgi:hypothetical protein